MSCGGLVRYACYSVSMSDSIIFRILVYLGFILGVLLLTANPSKML